MRSESHITTQGILDQRRAAGPLHSKRRRDTTPAGLAGHKRSGHTHTHSNNRAGGRDKLRLSQHTPSRPTARARRGIPTGESDTHFDTLFVRQGYEGYAPVRQGYAHPPLPN